MEVKRTFRPVPGLSREEEETQLAEIIGVAQNNLIRTEGRLRQLSDELYDLMETYGPKDKQALSLLHNTQSQLRERQRDLVRCQKARKKPYFGRIDFRDPSMPQDESYYVGRVGIAKDGAEPVVIDWRAPVASVYYENALGPCTYTVKNEGTYAIELKRKRTYEIEKDRLKDFFDSDVVANDELLTKYLAKSKTAVLGEIIATIQREQNAIIRKSPKANLIVQGVAGSGKTTVAMHRISYILYNYEDEFRPEDFYIIGSNRILLNYITSVLPDLDVYGVSQMTMEQLFVRLLYEDWNSEIHCICPLDKKNKDICIKGSLEWFHDLEDFCREYEKTVIPGAQVRLDKNGILLMEEAAIDNFLASYPQMSMQSKINMLNEILLAKLENELTGKYISYTPAEKKGLQRLCRWHFGKDPWKGSIFDVYRDFLQAQKDHGKEIPFPENAFDIYDLAALAYLYKRIKETDGIREASHVIIDEAQDFGMMAYGALAYCLRGCTYTIMGDVSQNIHFGYGLNDWKDLQDLILTRSFDSFGLLKKSYRNTVEISDFATEILRHGSFSIYPVDPIRRHGSEVRVTRCSDEDAMIEETVRTVCRWQKEGRETVAVICRDEAEASMLSEHLGKKICLADSNVETAEFGNGVMVLPVEYTKGLEFDAVLIYHPCRVNYPVDDACVKLLYVAATRALHELAIVHQGDLTDLIAKPVSAQKHMRSLEDETPASKTREAPVAEPQQVAADAGRSSDALPQPLWKDKSLLPLNTSSHHFGDCPENSMLRPVGHGSADSSIRTLKRTKKYMDLNSSYGTLRLTPLSADIIRVQFIKKGAEKFDPGYWKDAAESPVLWTARAGKTLVELSTGKLIVRVDKKTGALQFLDPEGKLLLAENPEWPRQTEVSDSMENWIYFDWQKNERVWAKGMLNDDLEPMNKKARYINFGGKKLRMPLLVSEYGYGIGIAAEKTVMCCRILLYGSYVYTDGGNPIDYYFIYGENYKKTLDLYKQL